MLRFFSRPRVWAVCALLSIIATGVALSVPHVRAWYHFRAAREDLRRYHTPQAIVHLKACLQVWPNNTEVWLMAARAARRARVYSDAEHYLEKYQQTRGCDEAVTFEQLLLTAERHVESVEDLCWRYVEQDHPEKSLLFEALARGYMRQYQLRKARMCLDHWRESEPENVQEWCLDGLLRLDYEKARPAAVECYRRAVELDAECDDARLGLAAALLESKLYVEAAEQLEHLRRLHPNHVRVRMGLAECRAEMGDTAESVRLLDELLDQHKDYAPALALRGRLALDSGQTKEAENWLRQALAGNPEDHDARYNLIRCLHKNDQEREAEEQKRQLEQRKADVTRFNEIVTRDLAQRPRDPALHCTLGQLLLRGGHREEGLRWLQSALRLDANYAPARQALAEHFQKKNSHR